MPISRRVSIAALWLISAAAACSAVAAEPKCHFTGCPPGPSPVVEFFNTHTGHYFQTAFPAEMEAIGAGGAGPGWVRTGVAFHAWITPSHSQYNGRTCESDPDPCRPVHRFYSAKSNSHFFTADHHEAAGLRSADSEWASEGIAFYVPKTNADGTCMDSRAPIHRLYNNRWQVNDSNHRFTPSASARKFLVDRGWTGEGVAFCAYGTLGSVVGRWRFEHAGAQTLQTPEGCRSAASGPDSCIAVRNLALPSVAYPPAPQAGNRISPDPFNDRLGYAYLGAINIGYPAASREDAAAVSFVQLIPALKQHVGIHLNARSAPSGSYSEISPYQRVTAPAADGDDDPRFFPWRARFGFEHQLAVNYYIGLKSRAAAPGSAAYGALSMEFLDVRSGHRLQFNVLSYGPEPVVAGDYIARDVKTGMAIVGIGSGLPSRFASASSPIVTERTSRFPATSAPEFFQVAMKRAQFQAIVDAARSTDPALSADPGDYVFERFGLVNETFGQGELAVNLFEMWAGHQTLTD